MNIKDFNTIRWRDILLEMKEFKLGRVSTSKEFFGGEEDKEEFRRQKPEHLVLVEDDEYFVVTRPGHTTN